MSEKKTIVVTGATRGLGLNFCKYISKLQWNIILIDISSRACTVYKESNHIKDIEKELKNNNFVIFKFFDTTNELKVKKFFQFLKKNKIKVDGLVNFAGGDIKGNDKTAGAGKPKSNNLFIKSKEFKEVFNRNFFSTLYMTREYIDFAKKSKIGKIVNTSSISGTFGAESEYAYSSSKSSIIHLTRSFALMSRKHNININCIAPCGTKTARFMSTLKSRNKTDLSRLRLNGLMGFAQPEDISKVVYFLLSDLSDFVSGQTIRIDGGEFSTPY